MAEAPGGTAGGMFWKQVDVHMAFMQQHVGTEPMKVAAIRE